MARSPNYPAHGLSEAVAFVRQVYDREKRTQVAGEDIAKALGYSSLSGNARSKIASMKKYDLLDGDEAKGMRVSELAVHLLYPANDKEALEAKRTAALSPELFRLLNEEKKEGSDESIKNFLVSRMDFTSSGAEQAVAAFRDTLSFAELNGTNYNVSSTPESVEANAMQTEDKSLSPVDSFIASDVVKNFGKPPSQATEAVNAWTWTLSMPRSVRADLRIIGQPTKADVTRLKKQIQALEESFDEDETPEAD
jgi:hypothetical protein